MPFLLLLAAAAAGAAPDLGPVNPNATELFDRDAALNAWALARFDTNHDGWLTLYEAQGALAAFKQVADVNHDGRVTVQEYEAAKRALGAGVNLASSPAGR